MSVLFRHLFVFFTPFFALGIVISFFNWFPYKTTICLLACWFVLLFIYLLKIRRLYLVMSCISLTLILFGKEITDLQKIPTNYLNKSIAQAIQIKEVDSTKKWVKVVGEVDYFLDTLHQLHTIDLPVVCYVKKGIPILPNHTYFTSIEFNPIKNAGNFGEFNAEWYWKLKQISSIGFIANQNQITKIKNRTTWWDKVNNKVQQFVYQKLNSVMQGQALETAQALIIGERAGVNQSTLNAFGASGAMHVLAVSGLHIGIFLQILLLLFGCFPTLISKRKAIVLALFLIWCYTFLSGMSASVLRSAVFFSLLSLGQLAYKQISQLNLLFATAFILFCWNPLLLFDIGFQLSFLAILGINLFYQRIRALFYLSNPILKAIWETTAVGFSAQLFTTPVTLYYFHQAPNYFWLTNIALMLVTGIILALALLLFLFYFIPILGSFVGLLLKLTIQFTLWTVSFIEHLPASTAKGVHITWWMVFIAFCIVLINRPQWRRIVWGLSFCWIALIIIHRFELKNKHELVFFHSDKTLFGIRIKEQFYCFYYHQTETIPKRLKQIGEQYAMATDSNVKFLALKNHKWKIESYQQKYKLTPIKQGYSFVVNGRKVKIDYRTCNDRFQVIPIETVE